MFLDSRVRGMLATPSPAPFPPCLLSLTLALWVLHVTVAPFPHPQRLLSQDLLPLPLLQKVSA